MKSFKKVIAVFGVCLLSLLPFSVTNASENDVTAKAKMFEQSVVDTLGWNLEFYPDEDYYSSSTAAQFMTGSYDGSIYYFRYYYNEERDELVQVLFESGSNDFRAYVVYNGDCVITSMYIR